MSLQSVAAGIYILGVAYKGVKSLWAIWRKHQKSQ